MTDKVEAAMEGIMDRMLGCESTEDVANLSMAILRLAQALGTLKTAPCECDCNEGESTYGGMN